MGKGECNELLPGFDPYVKELEMQPGFPVPKTFYTAVPNFGFPFPVEQTACVLSRFSHL